MAKRTLVEDVQARAMPPRRGPQTWFDRLSPEVRAELEEVRQAFNPAIHEKNSYAEAVIAAAAERGWQTAGRQGVIRWLERKSG